jgi:hypothetical protein
VASLRAAWPRRITGLRVLLLAVAVASGSGLALAAGLSGAGAKDYPAYSDPQKPVLSYLLSNDQNVEEFQKEFGLSDGKMKEVLAVVRTEADAVAREYHESDQIIESNKGASDTEIEQKISHSDFDEKVKQAVGRTKSDVEDLLPEGRADDLRPWVDEQWQEDMARSSAQSEPTYRAKSRGHTCKVWATYYKGLTKYEVALPHKKVKFSGGHKARITPVSGGRRVRAPVKESGPWNIRDNYWRASKDRSMWQSLPRCVPEAQAAFYDNYHRGKDQFGREVVNPAGMDITPAVARRMHLWKRIQFRGYIRVRVHFPWVSR